LFRYISLKALFVIIIIVHLFFRCNFLLFAYSLKKKGWKIKERRRN